MKLLKKTNNSTNHTTSCDTAKSTNNHQPVYDEQQLATLRKLELLRNSRNLNTLGALFREHIAVTKFQLNRTLPRDVSSTQSLKDTSNALISTDKSSCNISNLYDKSLHQGEWIDIDIYVSLKNDFLKAHNPRQRSHNPSNCYMDNFGNSSYTLPEAIHVIAESVDSYKLESVDGVLQVPKNLYLCTPPPNDRWKPIELIGRVSKNIMDAYKLFKFPNDAEQIALSSNAVVVIKEQACNWLKVFHRGRMIYLPRPYVYDLHSDTVIGGEVLALFDYCPTGPDELALEKGNLIRLVSVENKEPGWWSGYKINDRCRSIGLFPDNYVQIVLLAKKEVMHSATSFCSLPAETTIAKGNKDVADETFGSEIVRNASSLRGSSVRSQESDDEGSKLRKQTPDVLYAHMKKKESNATVNSSFCQQVLSSSLGVNPEKTERTLQHPCENVFERQSNNRSINQTLREHSLVMNSNLFACCDVDSISDHSGRNETIDCNRSKSDHDGPNRTIDCNKNETNNISVRDSHGINNFANLKYLKMKRHQLKSLNTKNLNLKNNERYEEIARCISLEPDCCVESENDQFYVKFPVHCRQFPPHKLRSNLATNVHLLSNENRRCSSATINPSTTDYPTNQQFYPCHLSPPVFIKENCSLRNNIHSKKLNLYNSNVSALSSIKGTNSEDFRMNSYESPQELYLHDDKQLLNTNELTPTSIESTSSLFSSRSSSQCSSLMSKDRYYFHVEDIRGNEDVDEPSVGHSYQSLNSPFIHYPYTVNRDRFALPQPDAYQSHLCANKHVQSKGLHRRPLTEPLQTADEICSMSYSNTTTCPYSTSNENRTTQTIDVFSFSSQNHCHDEYKNGNYPTPARSSTQANEHGSCSNPLVHFPQSKGKFADTDTNTCFYNACRADKIERDEPLPKTAMQFKDDPYNLIKQALSLPEIVAVPNSLCYEPAAYSSSDMHPTTLDEQHNLLNRFERDRLGNQLALTIYAKPDLASSSLSAAICTSPSRIQQQGDAVFRIDRAPYLVNSSNNETHSSWVDFASLSSTQRLGNNLQNECSDCVFKSNNIPIQCISTNDSSREIRFNTSERKKHDSICQSDSSQSTCTNIKCACDDVNASVPMLPSQAYPCSNRKMQDKSHFGSRKFKTIRSASAENLSTISKSKQNDQSKSKKDIPESPYSTQQHHDRCISKSLTSLTAVEHQLNEYGSSDVKETLALLENDICSLVNRFRLLAVQLEQTQTAIFNDLKNERRIRIEQQMEMCRMRIQLSELWNIVKSTSFVHTHRLNTP